MDSFESFGLVASFVEAVSFSETRDSFAGSVSFSETRDSLAGSVSFSETRASFAEAVSFSETRDSFDEAVSFSESADSFDVAASFSGLGVSFAESAVFGVSDPFSEAETGCSLLLSISFCLISSGFNSFDVMFLSIFDFLYTSFKHKQSTIFL